MRYALIMHARTVQLICVLITITCLAGSALMIPEINRQRRDLQLDVISEAAVRTLPPNEALTTAGLSIFRGVAVNVLWYRMNRLKEEGSFYEINQISNWLVTLQPRYPHVWSFMAWNMEYNISVATHTPEERWDWVNKGIRLLRERGIPNNPNSIRLYRELGWVFFHKIGQFSDDMNWYYKTRLATEWQEALGEPGGKTTQEIVDQFRAVAEAPDTLEQLAAADPMMPALLARLNESGFPPDETTLRRIGRIAMVLGSLDAKALGLDASKLRDDEQKLHGILETSELKPAVPLYLAYLRKKVITQSYRMDPAFMLKLMERYGPIDWRHPAAHACYWNSLGTERIEAIRKAVDKSRADRLVGSQDIELLNTYRGVMHGLQELLFRGRISFDPVGGRPPDLLPDPRFIDSYDVAYRNALNQLVEEGPFQQGTTEFEAGYENFLFTAINYAYFYGEREQAQRLLDQAHKMFGHMPDRAIQPRYTKPLDDVVFEETFRNLDLLYHARQFIDGMMIQAFSEGLMNNRSDVFAKYMEFAQRVHAQFNEKVRSVPNAPQDPQGLPPFERMLADGYTSYMRAPQLDPLRRFHIWSNTPNELRLLTYDRIMEFAGEAATKAGLDPQRAFPEPEGMEQWRKDNPVKTQTETDRRGPNAAEIERK